MTRLRFQLSEPASRRLELIVCALIAFLMSLWVSTRLFQSERITGDEGSYLFQAHAFADGVVRRDPGIFSDLLRFDMIILDGKAGWLSRYSPAHPLWLVPGVALGWPQVMTAVAAALTMACCFAIGCRLRLPRFLLPVLLLLSPFFLLLHGTLLSHTSGMAASAALLLFYMRWRQDGQNGWAVVAGLCWAFLFLNRTWTAALMAIPFAVDALSELRRERRNPRAWIGTFAFALASLLGVMLYLRYNKLTTGHSRIPTYLWYEDSEGLGFGPRRTQGGELNQINHSFRRGFGFFWNNVRNLDLWLLGTPAGTLLVWLGLAGHGWNRRWSAVLFGLCLVVPLGYIAFWFEGIPHVGPLYLAETLPMWLTLGALGFSRIWRRLDNRPRPRALLFGVMASALAFSSIRFVGHHAELLREEFGEQWALEQRLESLPGKNLIFTYGFTRDRKLAHYVYLNPRGLDSRILRLQADPVDHAALAACFPERSPWVLRKSEEGILPVALPHNFTRVQRDAVNSHHSRNTGKNDGLVRSTAPGGDTPGFLFYGWYSFLPPGDYECRFDLRWADVKAESPLRLEVMADFGKVVLGTQTLSAGLDQTLIRFRLDQPTRVEPRVYFGGSGSTTLRQIEIHLLQPSPR